MTALPKSDLWIEVWKGSCQTKEIPGTLIMNIDVMLFSTKPHNHKESDNDVIDLNANHRQKVLVDGQYSIPTFDVEEIQNCELH